MHTGAAVHAHMQSFWSHWFVTAPPQKVSSKKTTNELCCFEPSNTAKESIARLPQSLFCVYSTLAAGRILLQFSRNKALLDPY